MAGWPIQNDGTDFIMATTWTRQERPPALNRSLKWLSALGAAVMAGMLALTAAMVFQARADAWEQARQSSANLALALERDIARNLGVFDLSLQGAVEALKLPGIDQVSPAIRQAAIFDRAAAADYVGAVRVMDASGAIVADYAPNQATRPYLADRDYFLVHKNHADVGLYVSQPLRSRSLGGAPIIVLSRRLTASDGGFGGVVTGALNVAYFDHLFERLNVGKNGNIALYSMEGRMIARLPYNKADFGRDMTGSEHFSQVRATESGSYAAKSSVDGVERLYTFRHVGTLPLIITVGRSVADIDAAWQSRTFVMVSILGVLCVGTGVLCVCFRREMLRRIKAEGALTERAESLAVMAATDGLTGLANRRAFETELNRAWRQGVRTRGTLAVLMLDADCFKLYNDQYGHQAGDDVLRSIAGCIEGSSNRPFDFAARYGGEEFVVLLPDTSLEGGVSVAECIRGAVAAMAIPHGGNPFGIVTVSIGVAAGRPLEREPEDWFVKQADAALYASKRFGRNCVTVADTGQATLGSLAREPEILPWA